MLTLFLKYRPICLLVLCALLGLACSHLAAVLLGTAGSRRTPPPLAVPVRPAASSTPEAELGFILQHHLFDRTLRSASPVSFSLQAGSAGEAAVVQSDLDLVGTVVAGSRSLAMIRGAQGLQVHHLGAEIPGGKIEEILRHEVTIRNQNGSLTVLKLYKDGPPGARVTPSPVSTASAGRSAAGRPAASAPAVAGTTGENAATGGMAVRSSGENRWIVPRGTAEAARENIGEQLRTALIQPNLVNGKTDGFVIRSIQPGTLLAQMGLQRGDVIKRVNRMSLESPEKALQVMQQLREARQITIDLERGGAPVSFSYEIE